MYKDPTGHNILGDLWNGVKEAIGGKPLNQDEDKMISQANNSQTNNNSVAQQLNNSRDAVAQRGANYKQDLMRNLSEHPDNDGCYTANVNGTTVKIGTNYLPDDTRGRNTRDRVIDSINRMDNRAMGVLSDMARENDIEEMKLNSLFRSGGRNQYPHNEGRGIDLGTIRARGSNQTEVLDDSDYSHPRSEGPLTNKITDWARRNDQVSQMLTPWQLVDKTRVGHSFDENNWRQDQRDGLTETLDLQHQGHGHLGISR
jgi:hypothetical protein